MFVQEPSTTTGLTRQHHRRSPPPSPVVVFPAARTAQQQQRCLLLLRLVPLFPSSSNSRFFWLSVSLCLSRLRCLSLSLISRSFFSVSRFFLVEVDTHREKKRYVSHLFYFNFDFGQCLSPFLNWSPNVYIFYDIYPCQIKSYSKFILL